MREDLEVVKTKAREMREDNQKLQIESVRKMMQAF
jgi:hypothetical protein